MSQQQPQQQVYGYTYQPNQSVSGAQGGYSAYQHQQQQQLPEPYRAGQQQQPPAGAYQQEYSQSYHQQPAYQQPRPTQQHAQPHSQPSSRGRAGGRGSNQNRGAASPMQFSEPTETHQPETIDIATAMKVPAGEAPLKPVPIEHYANLFAAPIPKIVRNDDLLKYFEGFNATHASVMMDVHTGRSKGFGFITFDDPEEGKRALEAMNGITVNAPNGDSFVLKLSPSQHKKQTSITESKHVYFRNIPTCLTHDQILETLSQFGAITSLHVKNDNQHRWLLASVDYATLAEAKAAVEKGHGKTLFPQHSSFPVMVKYADNQATKTARRERRETRKPARQQSSGEIVASPVETNSSSSGFGSRFSADMESISLPGSGASSRKGSEFAPMASGDGANLGGNPLMMNEAAAGSTGTGRLDDDDDSDARSEASTSSSGKYRRNPYGGSVTVAVE